MVYLPERLKIFVCHVIAILLTTLWTQAAPETFLDFSQREGAVEVAGKKALVFTGAEKAEVDTTLELSAPMTIALVTRLEELPMGENGGTRIVIDASGTPFYDVMRIQWVGKNLVLEAGHSFMTNPTGLSVTFTAEEVEGLVGKWVFVGFSVKEGKAWGCIGGVASDELMLREAGVTGGGKLGARERVKFVLGQTLAEGKSKGGVAVAQAAFFREAMTPEQLAGLYDAVRGGKALNGEFVPADAKRVAELLKTNTPDAERPPEKTRVATDKMVLEFEDGWLVRWENLETGEKVNFGRPQMTRAETENRFYIPGPWWVDWKQPNLLATRTDWKTAVKEVSPTAVELQQSATRPAGREVHALQWGIQVPYDQVDAVHFPKGMPPSRLSGKGALGGFVVPSYDIAGRLGELSGRGSWRLRFYQIQGKTGGLLIYMKDPELDHFAALEFKKEPNGLIISNRSLASPPWKNSYTGGSWVVQQYTGYVGAGAQYYQDYLAKAYHLVPLKDRPTGWAKKLGLMLVNAPWTNPLPVPGKRRPEYNYSTKWEESIKAGEQWMDNLAKVIDPDKVIIYTVDWKAVPDIDRGLQDNMADPYFTIMCQKARARGFHVMLHICAPMITSDAVTYERYFQHQAKLFGLPEIQGHAISALSGRWVGEGEEGEARPDGSWTARSGYSRKAVEKGMNPAFEGYRWILAGSILSAVKATGADAIHLDVPNNEYDLRTGEYGMNGQQGYREFGKLLRGLLDESGLKNVAIGTEVTPSEALLPYVDFAQSTRGKSMDGFIAGITSGQFTLSEEAMLLGQSGEDLEKVKKIREDIAAGKHSKEFDPEYATVFMRSMRELGEPNINNMVVGPYVQAMPHLGVVNNLEGKRGDVKAEARNQLVDSYTTWCGLQHDNPPFFGGAWAMFMDVPPYDQLEVIQRYRRDGYANPEKSIRKDGHYLGKFDYGKLALARFWGDQSPQPLPPAKWAKEDIGLYSLKDGSQLRFYRSDPQTLRLELTGGKMLAELDLFTGWKNDKLLMEKYQPMWLKNQIEGYGEPVKVQ